MKNLLKNFVSPRFSFQIVIFVLLSIVLFACRQGQEPQTGTGVYKGFSYVVNLMGNVEITGYSGTKTDIAIPSQIENRPVVVIRGRQYMPGTWPLSFIDGALENKNLTSVILPDTLQCIYSGAFANNSFTEIHFPDNLTRIDSLAFMNNQLNSIVISNNVGEIAPQTFEGNKINNVTIGNGVEHIEYAAFRNNEITKLYLPEGLSSISWSAFEGNSLSRLSIPSGVRIWYNAFKGNSITHLDIGENVQLFGSPNFPVFELGFDEFFLGNESKAGSYLYENGKWEFMPGE